MYRAALFLLLPLTCTADTLYLCKSYGGGTFWSNRHCQVHNALIERIVPVASGLSFDQQVRLGEQAKAEGARLATPPVINTAPTNSGNQAACQALGDEIRALDFDARKLQAASEQDRISKNKRIAISRRLQLKCP